ncbi:alkaline phosphatase D family protein [Algicola sagamiensis]|uniref:alkaline phosphatase D family protein n=1 Tax=Algicola sagamiensis TaxID=163869 RepID=UPI00036637E9|nr:alkaline phosphatase D family protein [Algicola sagamiensis]
MKKNLSRRDMLKLMGIGMTTPFTLQAMTKSSPYADYWWQAAPEDLNTSLSEAFYPWGIASGDPTPTGVILWTRLNPQIVKPNHLVLFQISEDEHFQDVMLNAQIASSDISVDNDFTIRIDLNGLLSPNKFFFYRFIYDGVPSETGRCRTLPYATQSIESMKFAVATCQDFTTGYYNAYTKIADEDVDFVLHQGDFIYEYEKFGGFEHAIKRPLSMPSGHKKAQTIEDFRYVYRTYRSDKQLQKAMARHTWILIWDDHETANDCFWDYENDTLGLPESDGRAGLAPDEKEQLKRDAQKAWFEYVPARVHFDERAHHPHDALKIYRNFQFGDLIDLFVTDSRTYRTEPPCQRGSIPDRLSCRDYLNEGYTMLGHEQRDWLLDGITGSNATWKLWGNQTMHAQLAMTLLGHQWLYPNLDQWDGFQHERKYLMQKIKDADVDNFVVLTGDFHSSMLSYLKIDYSNIFNWDRRNLVGIELMTPSITSPHLDDMVKEVSNLDIRLKSLVGGTIRLNNPHIKHFTSSFYGYAKLTIHRDHLQWDVYSIDKFVENHTQYRTLEASYTYDPQRMWLRKN